jgi:hypothetical protein
MHRNICLGLLLTCYSMCASANLIRNASFESTPGPGQGQGLMPSEWVTVQSTPDTYSNDGSYGLDPAVFGNFSGVTAQDGIRWVAGWSSFDERFGQSLSAPLMVGQQYSLSGYLMQARRSDLDFPGGYQVYLTSDAASGTGAGELLGTLGFTSGSNNWEFSTFDFIAPADAPSLAFLLFVPVGEAGASAYAGLDNLNLIARTVPEPGSGWLLISGLIGFVSRRMLKSRPLA